MKIKIGKNTNRYRHDCSYHVDTTSEFGYFQPYMSQYLQKGDTFRVKDIRQLIRNAIMPSPTFGELKCVNDFSFVRVTDVYRQYQALISGIGYTTSSGRTYIPTKAPTVIPLVFYLYMLTHGLAQVSLFSPVPTTDFNFTDDSFVKNGATLYSLMPISGSVSFDNFASYFSIILSKVFKLSAGNFSAISSYINTNRVAITSELISADNKDLASADFVLTDFDGSNVSTAVEKNGVLSSIKASQNCHAICFKLTPKGKRFMKNLYGLGYTMDISSTVPMSVLPLVAYYKAWYDLYFPQRFSNYQQTNAYRFTDYVYENNVNGPLLEVKQSSIINTAVLDILFSLFDDMCDMLYTYSDSFESIHQAKVNEGASFTYPIISDGSSDIDISHGTGQNDLIPRIGASDLTSVGLRTLQRLTRYLNRNGLIGKRVSRFMEENFGGSENNALFPESKSVYRFVTDIDINDVNTFTDTFESSTGDGKMIGDRAAIGEGRARDKFSYTADASGFLFGFCAIYPLFNYYQGMDGQLLMQDMYSFPNAEFDALGYELTPNAMLFDDNGFSLPTSAIGSSSFGFIPRYSYLKNKRNIVNGDMRLRSTSASFEGYFLDAKIQKDFVSFATQLGLSVVGVSHNNLPVCGQEWSKVLKYPQLNYFTRIFLAGGFNYAMRDASWTTSVDKFDDLFTIQANFDCTVINKLKPLRESFDTFDETSDKEASIHNV